MINSVISDPVDEIIDRYEEDWTPQSRDRISNLLDEYELSNDEEALTELIRIDIELRYKNGIDLDLEEYFGTYDSLLQYPNRVAQIAFEDYRSRFANGQPVAANRWADLPGVGEKKWFQRLATGINPATSLSQIEKLRSDVAGPEGPRTVEFPEGELCPTLQLQIAAAGFKLIQCLGGGKLSRVYLAKQQDLANRFVVLKIVTRPLEEHENMAMLSHTNIVPIYSFHQVGSYSAICMPYAGSLTLEEFLNSEKQAGDGFGNGESLVSTVQARAGETEIALEEAGFVGEVNPYAMIPAANERAVLKPLDAIRGMNRQKLTTWIFQRLADGLAHSHARGIQHNDLKPGNVLIRNDGEPALLDFNLSQTIADDEQSVAGGTIPYMSPEALKALLGGKASPDERSDIYSLGVMMYHFATGKMLFPKSRTAAPTDVQAAIKLRSNPIVWEDSQEVSPGVRSIIERCLEVDPAKRYSSADELEKDLKLEHADESLVTAVEPMKWKATKFLRRHPQARSTGFLSAALSGLLIVAASIAITAQGKSKTLAAQADKKAFCSESATVLSAVMADPERNQERGVQAGLAPLEKFGLLNEGGIEKMLSDRLTPEDRDELRNTMFRHVGQTAFLEVDRLESLVKRDMFSENDLSRFKSLLTAAEQIKGDRESRAYLFLQARMASLTGETTEEMKLNHQAKKMDYESHDTEIYLEAVRRMSDGEYIAARPLLESLADRNTIPSALRWTTLGRTQYRDEQYEKAKLSFTQSINLAPKSATLMILRGLTHTQLKEGDLAIEDFTRAVELDPSNIRGYFNRGIIFEGRGRYEDAIKDFSKSLEVSPNNVAALLARSRVYAEIKKEKLAQQDFDRALSINDCDANSYVHRAKKLIEKGEPEAALQDFINAEKLDPENELVLMNIARVQGFELGQYDDSIETYNKILERRKVFETAQIDRALMLAKAGRFREAIDSMNRTVNNAKKPRTLYQAARVCALAPKSPKLQERALNLLSSAVVRGYETFDRTTKADNLEEESDFDSLRELERFKAIHLTAKLGNKIPRNRMMREGDSASQ